MEIEIKETKTIYLDDKQMKEITLSYLRDRFKFYEGYKIVEGEVQHSYTDTEDHHNHFVTDTVRKATSSDVLVDAIIRKIS